MATEYIPIDITNTLSRDYPDCWELVESFRDGKGKDLPDWNDRCYIPIAATIAIVTDGIRVDNPIEISHKSLDAAALAAVATWRIHKQVYTFSKELEELLYSQSDDTGDMTLPMDVIMNLPYDCIYIESPNLDENCHGFFVHIESDVSEDNPRLELRFLVVYNDKTVSAYMMHLLKNKSLFDCIKATIKEGFRQAVKMEVGEPYQLELLDEMTRLNLSFTTKMLQLVLYICAENAEIDENVEQSKIKRVPKSREFIKDKYREIEKFDCGNEITTKIRRLSTHEKYVGYHYESGDKGGASKSPHVRKAHWHHFWTGKRNSDERKLILKWLPPAFINADENDTEANIISINEIKDKS